MSINRIKLIYYELIEKMVHPSRVEKWLDYYIENGGNISDFQI